MTLLDRTINTETRALSLVLRQVSNHGDISPDPIIDGVQGCTRHTLDGALALLEDLRVIKDTSHEKCGYAIASSEEGGPKDFLILGSTKRVNVSPGGNRAVRVRTRMMAVRNDVKSRPCGSIIWSDKVCAPKYRLGPAQRLDPWSKKGLPPPKFSTSKKEKNNMAFSLDFEPALKAGEVVNYGFYLWTKNHYPLTRTEALKRYNDEWTREGFAVNDPSLFLSIKVELPPDFRYTEARAEKDPVLSMDGPNVPGTVLRCFKAHESNLSFEIEKPATGHYFVSWKTPD